MKLSVVVPIYNVEKYIRDCVDSLVNQTYKDIEIVLVDDGSPDNAGEICDEYAKREARIKVVHKVNGGLVSARKAGFLASSGDYVTFVDGDDWVGIDYYQRVFSQVGNFTPELIKAPRYFIAEEDTEPIPFVSAEFQGYFDRNRLEREVLGVFLYKEPFFTFGIAPSVCGGIFKREILELYLLPVPEEIRMGEDLAVTLPCIVDISDIYFTDVCGYFYRQIKTSITHSYNNQEVLRIHALFNYLDKAIKVESPCNLRHQASVYAVYTAYVQLVAILCNSDNMKQDLECAKVLLENSFLLEGLKTKLPSKVQLLFRLVKKNRFLGVKVIGWIIKKRNNNRN